jgi:hypothetical protein
MGTLIQSATINHAVKVLRWHARRFQTAMEWGIRDFRQSPIVFGNAMPKSGSHLLTQVLYGLTSIGPFVNPGFPPVNRDEANHPLSEKHVFANIYRMRPGDIRYGYIHAKEPYISLLTQPDQATIFIYRDPRDMLVSHIYYATDLYKEHGMHALYEKLDSMEARLKVAIEGTSEPPFSISNVRERYDAYIGWLEQPEVFCLRFEDLVLEQDVALARLIGFLEVRGLDLKIPHEQAIGTLKAGIRPQQSGTFRKGEPGNWREHFTEANKASFKDIAGDLLIRLGYEFDQDW